MDKKELYRQVFATFKDLCAQGKQPCTFSAYCRQYGVKQNMMPRMLREEFQNIKSLPGYKSCVTKDGVSKGLQYWRIYEDFKNLCASGHQPGSFTSYHKSFGVSRRHMHGFLKAHKLRIPDLPGFKCPRGGRSAHCEEVPFEKVIFEEAGFLPADAGGVISVKVNGHVEVNFPADTDVAAIVKFVRNIGKEAVHVES